MTDEQINIAIAEAIPESARWWARWDLGKGVVLHNQCESCGGCGELGGEQCGYSCPKCDGSGVQPKPIYYGPNFAEDLNAMHEAEKTMSLEQCRTYGNFLGDTPNEDASWSCRYIWSIPARQRAEAFVRTIGKWEGTP